MKEFIPSNCEVIYPESELGKLQALKTLFEQWYDYAKGIDVFKIKDIDHKYTADNFIYDGFFPYYFSQNIKILYIGRETRELGNSDNYIEDFLSTCTQRKKVSNFHKRMLYLTYAINKNFPEGLNAVEEWKEIPEADDIITNSFAKPGGISYAFMNFSKFMNDDENKWQANMELIDSFLKLTIDNKRNFIKEEIEILDPDLIITMNLGDLEGRLVKYLEVIPKKLAGDLSIYEFDTGTKKIPLFDTFHFSAWKKNDITDFYEPIKKACEKYLTKK